MTTCEHGHETNVFDWGEVHDCKKCGVCAFLEAEQAQAARNTDLLDRLIDQVLEYAQVDGLPNSHRNPEDCPDVDVIVPDRVRSELRSAMSEEMKEYVREIFPTAAHVAQKR